MSKTIVARTPVSVVLGGGGAKGMVHAGVLLELAEQGIWIDSIVGTSFGALIGAIFAYNRSVRYRDQPAREAQLQAARAVERVVLDWASRSAQLGLLAEGPTTE